MTEQPRYTIGDPVWSKMKGYCPWPSRIAAPTESSLKNTAADKQKVPKIYYLVYFFGSNNFAWMPEDTIKPYEEFKDKNKNGSRNATFKQGLKQIEEYIANGGKATLVDTTSAAIKNNNNNDSAPSPTAGDSLNNDASNLDGDLPSIDEEIAAINNKKPAATSPKKQKSDSLNESLTSPAPSIVQRDYSRTPFKSSSKKTAKTEESTTDITSPTKRAKTNDYDTYVSSSLSSPNISTVTSAPKAPSSKTAGARNVLLRAAHYTDVPVVERPQISMSSASAKAKSIRPSSLKFGFIGLGFMGQRLLKNLLNSGHQVTIWNRTPAKCKEFLEAGATQGDTPADVVIAADVVFSCLSDPRASKEIVFGSFGVLAEMNPAKALVEMSSIDPETSNDISEAIIARGGRYLEAPPIGNGKRAAEDGDLTIVAAGDKTLYEDCSSCFQAMGKQTFFLGHQVGYATKMNLILSMLYGTMVGAVAECCALVERSDLQLKEFRDILKLSIMNCPLTETMMDKIVRQDNSVHMPLGHLQKDLRLSLSMAEECEQTCPITAITNEVFKNSKKFGYADHDVSAVYLKSRY